MSAATVKHCLSSRYIYCHHRDCKDGQCPDCKPVRDLVATSQANFGSASVNSATQTIAVSQYEWQLGRKLFGNIIDKTTDSVDTIIGNKAVRASTNSSTPGLDYTDEFVLQKSSQCVPLIRYCSTLITPSELRSLGNEIVYGYHKELQSIVDEFFNGNMRTNVKRYPAPPPATSGTSTAAVAMPAARLPGTTSTSAMAAARSTALPAPPAGLAARPLPAARLPGTTSTSSAARGATSMPPGWLGTHPQISSLLATARASTVPMPLAAAAQPPLPNGLLSLPTTSLLSSTSGEVLRYTAPQKLSLSSCAYEDVSIAEKGAECAICLDPLRDGVVKIKRCGHAFHKSCIIDALSHKSTCPVCRNNVGEPQGKMPSGKMTITRTNARCHGYSSVGSIVIKYEIPSGKQLDYMDRPRHRFTGATRIAYLPDNYEGRQLVKRLKYAFMKGLTFVVGTSLTTGQRNVVTWASIHHKTNVSGGPRTHGFPDAGFFVNCNEELDGLSVPLADDCKFVQTIE